MSKYEITDIAHPDNPRLHRIRALVDIPMYWVKAGDLGGYIEKEDNLSQYDNCWVSDNGCVADYGRVEGYGWVSGNGRVGGNGCVSGDGCVADNGCVSGNGCVGGNARVSGNGWVRDNGCVAGYGTVEGNGRVSDHGCVEDCGCVSGYGCVFGDAIINKPTDILTIAPLGSRNACLTILCNKTCTTDCFKGTIDEFLAAVKETHGDNKYAKQYQDTIDYAYKYFNWERGMSK